MAVYRDRDGDVWTPTSDGMYAAPGLHPETLDVVRAEFGPLTPLDDDTAEETPTMTREEALAKATEHVDKLATNPRGFQDGVRFADKVEAVERLARFLTGEAAD